MKISSLFSSFAILLPLLSQAADASFPGLVSRQNGGQQGGGRNGNNNNGGGGGGAAGNGTNTGNTGNNNGTNTGGNTGNDGPNNGGGGNGDPQTSLTLDPAVVAPGFANDGQDVPAAGQVASLTSTNNFINFCLTVPNLPITNGKQIATGSCNPAPMGIIPSSSNMPSSKFTNPKNGDTIPANQAFTIQMAINNLVTGNFVNAQENYFSAPQQLSNGVVTGHSHVVVQSLTSLDQTTPADPAKFDFFKGLNDAAQGGVLSANVGSGLPAGTYRLCSINTAANHQPVLVPIAQHGSLDDCVYFTASEGGAGNNNGAANNVTDTGGNTGTGNNTATGGGNTNDGGGNNGGGGGGGGGGNNDGGRNQGGRRGVLRRRFFPRRH